MKTKVEGGTVETWWDRISRNWITQVLDDFGYQVGEADYTGHRDSAKVAHEQAVKDAPQRIKEWL